MTQNTRFSDVALEDHRLSMIAKGVFVTIGYVGNGCQANALKEKTTETPDAIQKALKELEQFEYVILDADGSIHINYTKHIQKK